MGVRRELTPARAKGSTHGPDSAELPYPPIGKTAREDEHDYVDQKPVLMALRVDLNRYQESAIPTLPARDGRVAGLTPREYLFLRDAPAGTAKPRR